MLLLKVEHVIIIPVYFVFILTITNKDKEFDGKKFDISSGSNNKSSEILFHYSDK